MRSAQKVNTAKRYGKISSLQLVHGSQQLEQVDKAASSRAHANRMQAWSTHSMLAYLSPTTATLFNNLTIQLLSCTKEKKARTDSSPRTAKTA